MTICIVTPHFPPETGGIATFYGHLSSLLKGAGHNVIVLTTEPDPKENEEDKIITGKGFTKVVLVKSYAAQLKKYQPYFSAGDLDAPSWIAKGFLMRNWLKQNHSRFKVDIIEVSDYGGLGIFLCDNDLPPVVITGHGAYLQLSRYNPSKNNSHSKVIRDLERLSFKEADALLPYSPLNRHDLQSLTGREVAFCIAAWEDSPIQPVTKNEGNILVIGGLQKIKGAVATANAIRICAKQDEKIKLFWIGNDTYTAPGLKSMSEFLRKQFPDIWNKNFIWLGNKTNEEVMERIAKSDFVVLPAEWETFNFVALEASSMHKPIIITEKTGAATFFLHEKDAYIIPSGDPDTLASAIIFFQNNPGTRAQLGQAAAAMVKKVFNPGKITGDRITIYHTVIQNRKPHTSTFEQNIHFLKKYQTGVRKLYYGLKKRIKNLLPH